MTLHWFSNKKNSEQSMAAYAAQKPTHKAHAGQHSVHAHDGSN